MDVGLECGAGGQFEGVQALWAVGYGNWDVIPDHKRQEVSFRAKRNAS